MSAPAILPRVTHCEDCRASVRLEWQEIPEHVHHLPDSYFLGLGFCDCGWRTLNFFGPDPVAVGMLAGVFLASPPVPGGRSKAACGHS